MSDWLRLAGPLAAWSSGHGPRLVFVHGFTQTSNSWKPIAGRFAAAGYESVIVDLPGHGDSGTVSADLVHAGELLVDQCGRAVYVGYSLGGRLCLHAALAHPADVRGLALIGASPGIEDSPERSARRAADDRLADNILDVGVEAFLDQWLALPLFDGLALDADQRADRSRNFAEGLADSLRLAGTGAQESLWSRLDELDMPVLAIAGERDDKFASIAKSMAKTVSRGQSMEIPAAGHAAHLQDPQRVTDALSTWLGEISY